ncbi:MAG TPA: four helix bundle protein [Panacibacter sp.]|nr:four helix bundle protein [Panacibacter sp.]
MNSPLPLEDLEIYQVAIQVGETIWSIVIKWDSLAKRTVGEQLVRAADSIAANIAEGYGRYFYKDRKQFCYYSRGSLLETKTWITKALERKLISQSEYDDIMDKLKNLHFKLNTYIKKLKENSDNNI